MQESVAVVIVNYRTADLVVDCLRSLEPEIERLGHAHVFVADNDSGDDSVLTLRRMIEAAGHGPWVTLLPLPRNGGFAHGCNEGIRAAIAAGGFDLYYLLNPDTVVRPGAVQALARCLRETPAAGLVGGALELPDGSVAQPARRFPTPFGELLSAARLGLLDRRFPHRVVNMPPADHRRRCDWVSGASLMIRHEVIERIGLLDDGYFLYFEEVDYCRRAADSGYEVWIEPASCVLHLEGASTGIKRKNSPRGRWWYDSRRRFFVKTYGLSGLVLADVMWGIGRLTLVARTLLRAGGGTASDPARFAWDLLWGDLVEVMTGRARRAKETT